MASISLTAASLRLPTSIADWSPKPVWPGAGTCADCAGVGVAGGLAAAGVLLDCWGAAGGAGVEEVVAGVAGGAAFGAGAAFGCSGQ